MNSALQRHPQSYPILHAQCDFLLSKSRPKWAQAVAQEAVTSAPSEFVTWAKLTQTFIELGQFDSALLTLNSCPMFTFNDRDLHRMPAPARTHLPVKRFLAESNILDEESAGDTEVSRSVRWCHADDFTGRYNFTATSRSWTSRNICQSLCAVDEHRFQDRVGRNAQDPVYRIRHGGRVQNPQNHRISRYEWHRRRQRIGHWSQIAI